MALDFLHKRENAYVSRESPFHKFKELQLLILQSLSKYDYLLFLISLANLCLL